VVVGIDDFGLLHFVPKVVTFTGTLTDTGEHRESTVVERDVIDELHDDDRLADAGAAEETDLAALAVRLQEIDDFNAGLEHFSLRVLIFQARRRSVDGVGFLRLDRTLFIDRLTQHVDQPSQGLTTDGNRNRGSRVLHIHAASQTVRRRHRDAADAVFTKVRRNFERDPHGWLPGSLILFLRHLERIVDVRQLTGRELHVDHGADDLNDFSCAHKAPLVVNAAPGGLPRAAFLIPLFISGLLRRPRCP
jgi:hypothetical protein